MEASARLLSSPHLTRHLLLLPPKLRSPNLPSRSPFVFPNPNPRARLGAPLAFHPLSASTPSPPFRNPNPFFASLLSLPASHFSPFNSPQAGFCHSRSGPTDGFSVWDPPSEVAGGEESGFGGEKGSIWMVVLLGWLGAEPKHLKRYAEIYHARGVRSLRFVVPVREVLGFDLGRRVEERVAALARELAAWLEESEKDGRERNLVFHTFSNTGWLIYGSLLQNFQSRSDIIEKIRGCIVDSGAAAEISPQVWAAGFCAALLKKRSSLTYAAAKSVEGSKLDGNSERQTLQDMRPTLIEIIALSILKKIFSIILMLPDVNQRLTRIISILSNSQPPCPQLYLYSSADKVIPACSVECFIRKQKTLGRDVRAYDFGSSPHVDHFRSFPDIYASKIDEFLKDCCFLTVCHA